KFLYRKSLLPIWKTLLYSTIGIIYISVTLGFIQDYITDTPHILEGKFGYWTNQLLNAQIGKFGVGGLIVFAYLAALVLIYNLDLKFAFSSIGSTSSESENSGRDRKSTRLNSSHVKISYAVFCLKKKRY